MPAKFAPTRVHKRKHRERNAAAAAAGAGTGTTTESSAISQNGDTNALMILPKPKDSKPKIKQNGGDDQQNRASGKKAKRLEKYIEKKLKKDEAMGYLRLLEEQEAKRQQAETGHVENTFVENVKLGKRKRDEKEAQRRPSRAMVVENAKQGDGESEDEWEAEHPEAFNSEVENASQTVLNTQKAPQVSVRQGIGLAQPLQLGADGLPIIETRRKINKKRKIFDGSHKQDEATKSENEDEEEPWGGFSEDDEPHEPEGPVDKIALIKALAQDIEDFGSSDEASTDMDDDEEEEEEEEEGEDEEDEEDEDDVNTASDEDSSDSDHSHTSTGLVQQAGRVERTSAFKAWATQQINKAIGHTPSYEQLQTLPSIPKKEAEIKPSITSSPPPQEAPPSRAPNRKAYAVHITRDPEIEASRSSLPILAREQEVMEAIHNHDFVIVTGSTGSGKTTQLPQFLYEAGYGSKDGPTPGMIGITQPRRIAATSMAERVRVEMGDHGYKVGYQIRYESKVGPDTAVKFMTDGILIRELQEDLLLKRYSVLIIDEAHERSVNTDVLIGILSKVVPARLKKSQWNPDPKPLKVVVMSATLHVDPFLDGRLFKSGTKPPIVEVEGRQHNVSIHFALRSRADYVEEVVEKVRRAHRKLPKGGILVFLTGQHEIREVGRRLQKLLVNNKSRDEFMSGPRVQVSANETPMELEDLEIENVREQRQDEDGEDDFDDIEIIADEDDYNDDDDEDKEFDITDDEQEEDEGKGEGEQGQTNPTRPSSKGLMPYTSAHILPLYAQLPKHSQKLIFEPPPPDARLIVLATNVAETSITIPNIRYVFDTGRAKTRKYSNMASTAGTGVQSFEIDYISKASAAQRAGRAGRTGPGHCWRLYTSAVYEQFFPDFSEPQILTEPAESVVLMLKGIDYPKPISHFPFPTVPHLQALQRAESLLRNLGALGGDNNRITLLGKEMGRWPLGPRLAKCMTTAVATGVAELVTDCIRGVAGLAVGEVFVAEASAIGGGGAGDEGEDDEATENGKQHRDDVKQAFGRARAIFARHDKTSDAMRLITAVSMYEAAQASEKADFCQDYFLRQKAMSEVSELERQLVRMVKFDWPQIQLGTAPENKARPKQKRESEHHQHHRHQQQQLNHQLNAIFASGYIDQVAIRADLSPNPPEMLGKPKRAIDVPYLTLMPLATDGPSAAASLMNKAVFIHPSSVLARVPVRDLPKFIVYTHLQKSQAKTVGGETVPKTRMFPLAPVDAVTLIQLAKNTPLLEFGKPITSSSSGGAKIEELKGVPRRRECVVAVEMRAGKSGFGWPLGGVKVRQVVDVKSRSGWRTEEVYV